MIIRSLRLASFCALLSVPVGAADITVTTDADVINGNTASPALLEADAGPDGISLREAIDAANRSGGRHTIRFAPGMDGRTILVRGAYYVTADSVTLLGLRDASGRPTVTLDGSAFDERASAPHVHEPDILTIHASGFRMSHMRIVNVKHRAVVVQAGPRHGGGSGAAAVRNVTLSDNEFDTSGFPSTDPYVDAIRVWIDVLGGARGAAIENLVVARNLIDGFHGNGVIVSASGDDGVIRNVDIDDNEISDTGFPIEVNVGNGSRNVLSNVRIRSNRAHGSSEYPGIFVGHVPATGSRPGSSEPWPPAVSNVIEHVEISRNQLGMHIQLDSGTSANGRDNVVRDVTLAGNTVRDLAGVFLLDGDPASTGNRLEDIRIVNHTLVSEQSAINAIHRGDGNAMQRIKVENSIVWTLRSSRAIAGLDVSMVSNSITNTAGFAGVNGNLDVDPGLVDAQAGDFRLRPESPAVDRASDEAPATDVLCRARVGVPDLGAFEHSALPVFRLTVESGDPAAVATNPIGMECGRSTSFPAGTVVELLAGPGYRVMDWSGDPDCDDGTVSVVRDLTCEARVAPARARPVRR